MQIVMLAAGTYGDVPPCVALGLGLQQAGHRVRIATYAEFEDLVSGHGLDFAALRGNPQEQQQQEEAKAMMASVGNVYSYMRHAIDLHLSYMHQLLIDSWRACQGADAIVFAINTLGGHHIAEKLNIPCFTFWYHPLSATTAFPQPLITARMNFGGGLNRLSYVGIEQFFWQFMRPMLNRWRQETLELPPLPLLGGALLPITSPRGRRLPFLYGYSPSVAPSPADWQPWQRVTGFWFLDRAVDWQPPPDLVAFLGGGPPPVCVGFGSMIGDNPAAMTRIVLKALRLAGRRAVLVTGWGGLSDAELSNDIFIVDRVPYDWLFPQMAAVVHHAGVGTLALGLRAGVPTVRVPFTRDELYWGWQVAKLRVGPAPLPRTQLTAERLANAIRSATDDVSMRSRATALGKQIQREDGVARAVEVIHSYLLP